MLRKNKRLRTFSKLKGWKTKYKEWPLFMEYNEEGEIRGASGGRWWFGFAWSLVPRSHSVKVHSMYPPSSICTSQYSFVILRIVAVVIKNKRLIFLIGSKHSSIYKVIETLTWHSNSPWEMKLTLDGKLPLNYSLRVMLPSNHWVLQNCLCKKFSTCMVTLINFRNQRG